MSKDISRYMGLMIANGDRIEARNKIIQEANEPFNAIKSMNFHFHEGAGSNSKDIQKIAGCFESGNPFGLRLGKDRFIAFIPDRLTAYMFGHSADKQIYANLQSMMDAVSLTYLTHKEFVSTKKLLKTLNAFKLKAPQNKKLDQ